ncbi:MAG: YfhO family protein [Burkholderiales bacterium]|nr:YfhO family protein [Burkholderiales bacterium]
MTKDFLKSWLVLFSVQALLAAAIFHGVLDGSRYFAYLDVGADTYAQMSAHAMHMARQFMREGWPGWSFQIGMGAPTAWLMGDTLLLLAGLAGPEHVLELRIWVYLFKVVLAGTFFLMLARRLATRPQAALVAALAYSFCGYAVVNGQWDGEANAWVFFPLVLWAISRHLREGGWAALPVAVAATLLSGVFFFTAGVSLLVACAGFVASSDAPRAMFKAWLTRIFPLAALGFLLAAPYVLPFALQLLDSPRLAGAGSAFSSVWAEALGISGPGGLLEQLGGLLHKDIFGIGNLHSGPLNYLEAPEFYIGVLPLLVIPQLWSGGPADRRALLVGLAGIAAYVLFPIFRLAGMGFAVPYFRSTAVWVTLGLMLLSLRALDGIFTRGTSLRLLLVGIGAFAAAVAAIVANKHIHVWLPHAMALALLAAGAGFALVALNTRLIRPRGRPVVLMALVCMEILAVAPDSFFWRRQLASPENQPFHHVAAMAALRNIRRTDPSVYRVEKTFDSMTFGDAVAQDYMGLKSYYYQGSAIVDFHSSMDLMPGYPWGKPVNYTNWLPPPGSRYPLYSLLGVRYVITDKPVQWPGFRQVDAGAGFMTYRNELALPLGIVQARQVTRQTMAALDTLALEERRRIKDAVLMNAVVVDEPLAALGKPLDIEAFARGRDLDGPATYAQPARALQATGLVLSHFASDRVAGRIQPAQAGVLVFSIPAYQGWSLRIDGQPTALMRANFGMLAAPVTAGPHEVELDYQLPGRRAGLLLGLAGCVVLVFLRRRGGRARRA